MSTNTLNDRSSGQTILEGFFNDIHLAMKGDLVGRDSSGVPASGQNLGTAAFPWGNVHTSALTVGGSSLDVSQIASPANRIVSGKVRTTSNQGAFLTPAGTAGGASFTLEAATTNLILEINASSVTYNSDIVKGSLTLAAGANNTCLVNDTDAAGQKDTRTWGEIGASKEAITYDAAGSEITTRDGELAAFQIGSELFIGRIDDTNSQIKECLRGYFYNSSLAPINRSTFSDNDTITIMSLGYVFAEDDSATIDVTYAEPTFSFSSPTSPATGDYWFDLANKIWKRYDGVTFQIINRTFIGYVVLDDTDCIGARAHDFDARNKEENSMVLRIKQSEIIEGAELFQKIFVSGNEIDFGQSRPEWNITTDLAGSADMYQATEQATTLYFLYVSDQGETIISDIEPYFRGDLLGYYHPHNPWRMVGSVVNDGSSDFVAVGSEAGEGSLIINTSDTKTGVTSNTWFDITNGELLLPWGDWELHGQVADENAGVNSSASTRTVKWSSANGDDTSTEPADLDAQDGLTIIGGTNTRAINQFGSSSGAIPDPSHPLPTIQVRSRTEPVSVFIVGNFVSASPSNVHISTHITARKQKMSRNS